MPPKKSPLAIVLAFIVAASAVLAVYTYRIDPEESSNIVTRWLYDHRAWVNTTFLILGLCAGLAEAARLWLIRIEPDRGTIQRLLDDFVAQRLKGEGRRHRLTLFKKVGGVRAMWIGLRRIPVLGHGHRWKAWRRIKFGGEYLVVFARARDARNRNSPIALRVGDLTHVCEGMAGRAWDEGFAFAPNLPSIEVTRVRAVTSLDALPASDPIRAYAEAANMRNLTLLQSVDTFAKHFMGHVVRRPSGSAWGVLLLDSDADTCPFPARKAKFQDDFKDRARVISMILP